MASSISHGWSSSILTVWSIFYVIITHYYQLSLLAVLFCCHSFILKRMPSIPSSSCYTNQYLYTKCSCWALLGLISISDTGHCTIIWRDSESCHASSAEAVESTYNINGTRTSDSSILSHQWCYNCTVVLDACHVSILILCLCLILHHMIQSVMYVHVCGSCCRCGNVNLNC